MTEGYITSTMKPKRQPGSNQSLFLQAATNLPSQLNLLLCHPVGKQELIHPRNELFTSTTPITARNGTFQRHQVNRAYLLNPRNRLFNPPTSQTSLRANLPSPQRRRPLRGTVPVVVTMKICHPRQTVSFAKLHVTVAAAAAAAVALLPISLPLCPLPLLLLPTTLLRPISVQPVLYKTTYQTPIVPPATQHGRPNLMGWPLRWALRQVNKKKSVYSRIHHGNWNHPVYRKKTNPKNVNIRVAKYNLVYFNGPTTAVRAVKWSAKPTVPVN